MHKPMRVASEDTGSLEVEGVVVTFHPAWVWKRECV
jgi:hypothetical protein